MTTFAILFLLGDIYLHRFAVLPSQHFLYSLTVITFVICQCTKTNKYIIVIIAFLSGFLWSAWYANNILKWELPKAMEGQTVMITGHIASIPITNSWSTYFNFAVSAVQFRNLVIHGPTTFSISWRTPSKDLRVGDKWHLLARLKRIHSTQNPGAFDYEAWALQKGLRASGYVITSAQNKLLSHDRNYFCINQFRQYLYKQIEMRLPNSATSPWLLALILGEHNNISSADWRVLRQTGTNHLMAIAGLHIGLIAGFIHFLITFLWRRIHYLVLWFPAQQAGACAALITALFYSALAGFSLPTQRASIMLCVFIMSALFRRKVNHWHSWSFAMLLVLMLNPMCVLTESFWLSFGTIALIIYGMDGRLAPKGLWWRWGRVQWVIGFGLLPLTLALFQQFSLISFIANSIAIPWLGFFILPFCLLSVVCIFIAPTMTSLLLLVADKSLSVLWIILNWLSDWSYAASHLAIPSSFVLITTTLGIILLLAPRGFVGRWFGICGLMPLIFIKPLKPNAGEVWFSLLDVGQGLSAVIQTRSHLLVYDAGPKYNTNFDMGERVVLPYLRHIGATKIDALIISHGDNDHIGGAFALLKEVPVRSIKTSVPEKFINYQKIPTGSCVAGNHWEWDQVHFRFLYPSEQQLGLGNDSSCVLLIDNGKQQILLTGDIEKYAEKYLLTKREQLHTSILVAPHHGSKTSGIKAFITATHPEFVLYATGYRNRYHFPHQSIINSYAFIHAEQLNTAETGMIQFKLKNSMDLKPLVYRILHKRFWM